jgi:hypothetical protein
MANIKDIAPEYEYGSNRTTQTQIQTDAGISGTLGLQMLQTTSVRVANARTYPSRLPSSDPSAFRVGPQGQITMSSDLYPASFYAPAYPGAGQIEIGPIGTFETVELKGRGTVDPANFFYLTSDTKVQDPLNVEAPAGISTPPTGTMGFFPVNKVPMGWITLGGSTRYIYKRAYTYRYIPTNTILSPSDPLIGSDPANCIPAFANTEYTAIYNILKSWDLVGLETASMYELVFATKNPFSGYFVRTANPTFEGIAQNTHPFETEGQYMSNHSHDGYTYPNYASPINTYHASSKLPLVNNYLIDDLAGSKVPDTTTVNWVSVWAGGATANSSYFHTNKDLGHDIRLFSYRKTNGTVLVYDSEEELKPADMNPITWVDGRQNGLPTILNWNENIDLTIDIHQQFSQLTNTSYQPLYNKGNNYASQFDYIALEYCHPTIFGKYDYFGKLEPVANEQIQYELFFEKYTAGGGPSNFTLKFWNWKGTRLLIIDNGGPEIEKAFRGIGNQWAHAPTWNSSIKICDLNIYDIYRYAMLFGIQPSTYGAYLPSKLKIWIRPNVNGVQFTNTHDLSLVYKDLNHVTHDAELKEDYLKKVLSAGIYHIANNTRSNVPSIPYANRKWNPITSQFEPSPSIHTIEVRSLDNSLNLDKGRTSYHVERVNRWNNADTDYYNRRGFYEPHLGNLVYANSDFGVANTNQRIGTSYMFNYRYTFGSEWGQEGYTVTPPNVLPTWAHDAGSVFAQSTLKDVAPFTVIDHANIQHSVINYDTHVHTRIKTYHRSLVDRRLDRKQSSPILGWQRNPSGYVRTIGPEGLAISGLPKTSTSSTVLSPKKSRWVIKKDFSKSLSDASAFPNAAQGNDSSVTVGSSGSPSETKPTGFPYETWDKNRFNKLNSLPSFNQLWNANPDGTITANYSTEAEDNNPIETGGSNPSFDDPTNTPGISFQQGTKPYHVPNWRFRRLRASYNGGGDDSIVSQHNSSNSDTGVSPYVNPSDLSEYDYLGGGAENEVSKFLGIKDSARATEISVEGEGNNVQYNKVWMHVGLPASYRFENSLTKQNSSYSRKLMRGLKSHRTNAQDRQFWGHHRGHFFSRSENASHNHTFGQHQDNHRNHGHQGWQHYTSQTGHSDNWYSNYPAYYPHNLSDQPSVYHNNGGRRSSIQSEYAGPNVGSSDGANYIYHGNSGYGDKQVRKAENNSLSGASKGSNRGGLGDIYRNKIYTGGEYNHVSVSGPYGALSPFNTGDRAVAPGTITTSGDGGSNDGAHFGVRIPWHYKINLQLDGSLSGQSNHSTGTQTDTFYNRQNERAGEKVERQQSFYGKRMIAGSTYGDNPWVVLNHEPFSGAHGTMRDLYLNTSGISVSGAKVDKLSTFNLPREGSNEEIGTMYRYLDRYNPEDQRNLYAFLSDYYSAYDIATEDYAVNNYTYKNPYFADARKQKQYRNYTGFRTRSDRYLTVNTKHQLDLVKEDQIYGHHIYKDESSHFFRNFGTNYHSRHDGADYGHRFVSIYNRGSNHPMYSVQTGKYRHYHPKDVMDFSLKQSLQSKPEFFAPCHITRSDELTEDPYRLTFLNTGSSGPLAQRTTTVGGHEHDLIYANTTFRGDTEFRPINIALVPCIKV